MKKELINLSASIICSGNAVGAKEYAGPLGKKFDFHDKTDKFGQKTWEKAESEMQRLALNVALNKGDVNIEDIEAVFAGDLLNQCVGSAYGLLDCKIPYFGIYGACSTSAEGLMLASIMTTHKVFSKCAVVTSSHNCSAERQYRTPIEYGAQRPPTAQWTVTGAGSFIIGEKNEGKVQITQALPGKVIDKGINDASNMGAAMAPAVCDTMERYFNISGNNPLDFDLILTGDLGHEGAQILKELLNTKGYTLGNNYNDCGKIIFDKQNQDTHSGGSGCGCAAVVLSSYIIPQMEQKKLKKVLFIASGAMMSPDSIKQGQSIPAIGHLVCLEI